MESARSGRREEDVPVCGTEASLPTGHAWWFGFIVQAFAPHAATSTDGGIEGESQYSNTQGRATVAAGRVCSWR